MEAAFNKPKEEFTFKTLSWQNRQGENLQMMVEEHKVPGFIEAMEERGVQVKVE